MIFFNCCYGGKLGIIFQSFHFIGKVIIRSVAGSVVDNDNVVRVRLNERFPTCFCPGFVNALTGHDIVGADEFANKVERLKNNPQLSSVTAIKENHFLRVRLAEITPGVRTVDALERLVKEIHPDMK